jgi:diketogulonate reductase-like aldo/keto reductase
MQNEEDIALGLAAQGVPRNEVFITSKISPYEQGRVRAAQACEEILTKLQTDYLVSRAW